MAEPATCYGADRMSEPQQRDHQDYDYTLKATVEDKTLTNAKTNTYHQYEMK